MIARSIILVCLVVAPLSSLVAQWGSGERPAPRPIVSPGPRAVFDLLAFKRANDNAQTASIRDDAADSTRMDLYLAVDYNSLEFLYAIDKYVADYSVTIQITTAGTLILDRYEAFNVLESTTEHQARVENHRNRADAQQISFLIAPGRSDHTGLIAHDQTAYNLRLSVQDYASHNAFDTSFSFTVKDFTSASPAMSDLMIFRDRKGMHGVSPTTIVPSIGPDVSSLADEPAASGLFAELYNMPADSTLGIVTEILHTPGSSIADDAKSRDKGSFVSRSTTILHIPSASSPSSTAPPSVPVTPLFAPVSFEGLWTGFYTLHTYILPSARDTNVTDPSALEARSITSAQRQILVTIAEGIPISSGDLDQAIAQLGVIATGAEWDSLSSAHTPEQKRDAILDFWKKKDERSSNRLLDKHDASASPTMLSEMHRAMEVFYSRVDYANSHFGTTFQAGWKSDRGRVYIELGSPDLIDSHPEGYAQAYGGLQKPYEIWEYSRMNERYTFVDEYMLGDYRLRGAPPPEGTFIWN